MLSFCLQSARRNCKIYLIPSFISVLILAIGIGFITDLRNCDAKFAYTVCQRFFSVSGILLLGSVFTPEQKDNISETVAAKAMQPRMIYALRLCMGLIALITSMLIFFGFLILIGGTFDLWKYTGHSIVTALFLGGLCMAGSRFSGNVFIGYMLTFGVYIFHFFAPAKWLDFFTIFTLRADGNNSLIIMLLTSVAIISLSFVKRV